MERIFVSLPPPPEVEPSLRITGRRMRLIRPLVTEVRLRAPHRRFADVGSEH